MSLNTWLKVAVPRDAEEHYYDKPVSGGLVHAAVLDAQLKWEHLRPSVLKEHGVVVDDGDLRNVREDGEPWGEVFYVDSSTCSLCRIFSNGTQYRSCAYCPITLATGETCAGYRGGTPFEVWLNNNNPEPMLKVLEKARKFVIKVDAGISKSA